MNQITDENFNKIESQIPILLDFYADWCGPCKMLEPIIEEIAKTYENKLIVYKANTENCTELLQKFNVMSIPTIIFLNKNKEILNQIVGFHNKDLLIKTIDEILKN